MGRTSKSREGTWCGAPKPEAAGSCWPACLDRPTRSKGRASRKHASRILQRKNRGCRKTICGAPWGVGCRGRVHGRRGTLDRVTLPDPYRATVTFDGVSECGVRYGPVRTGVSSGCESSFHSCKEFAVEVAKRAMPFVFQKQGPAFLALT